MELHKLLKTKIRILIDEFCKKPNNYFHEREIHSFFFNLCQSHFGEANPKDCGTAVNLFRQEYETIWRYKRRDEIPFDKKYTNVGTTGAIDFVILNEDFVKEHDLLTIINKDEKRRNIIRHENITIPAINVGIEFKMAHWRTTLSIENGAMNKLKAGLLEDCRKLAQERIPHVYTIAFSHGKRPEKEETEDIINECKREYTKYNSKGNIHILIITPGLQSEL